MEEVSGPRVAPGMKIRHSELEVCRKNPAAWFASAGSGFATFGYKTAIKLAIFYYHRTASHKAAQEKLEEYLQNFVDAQRKQWARDTLDNYVVAFGKSDWLVADTKLRLWLELGHTVVMSGEMSRIDIHPQSGRYQALLLSADIDGGWTNELRWPLMQLAVSEKYSRAVEEVSVGLQTLDGATIDTKCFSKSKISKCMSEAADLAETINSLSAKSK